MINDAIGRGKSDKNVAELYTFTLIGMTLPLCGVTLYPEHLVTFTALAIKASTMQAQVIQKK